MIMIFPELLFSTHYIPHGHCYLWQIPLVWLHVVADSLIALAYFSIPIMLVYFVRKREDIPFKRVFVLFSAFILSCGTTHIMGIITLWYPFYWISGVIKGITALISVLTALELFPLIPKALALPSPHSLEILNREISQLNSDLEQRVQERTNALETINQELIKHNQQMCKLTEVNEFLQLCKSLGEAKKTLAELLKPLFPKMSGSVYLINESRNVLEEFSSWGTLSNNCIFLREDCWALRKGSSYIGNTEFPALYCDHFSQNAKSAPSICVPMNAQGKIFGSLHLNRMDLKQITQSSVALAQTVAQQVSLSLANLRLQENLRDHSLRDPLTGLFNRRYLEESATREIHRAIRNNNSMGIIVIDIDYFKKFNDTYGHAAGDFVLVEVSQYLRNNTRNFDVACRYGGEEFVLLLPDVSLENTCLRAESIRKEIQSLNLKYEQQLLEITISLGVASFPEHGCNLESLINRADQALYKA